MSGRRRTLTQIRASLRWHLFSRRITRLKLDPSPWPTVYLGSGYGGYGVPDGLIERNWTCYCIGTGRDITFDLALIRNFADPGRMALSRGDLEGSGESVEVPMRSLPSLMEELGHDRIDLMKLAVEGMEYELLESINPSEFGVRVLLVEFTWSRPVAAALSATEALRAQGYRPVFRHLGDVTFVHQAAVESSRLEEVASE